VVAVEVAVRKRLGAFRLDAAFAAPGGITALVGPSGSGKTQTLRCVAGLARPDDGRVVAAGRVLFDRAAGVDLPTRTRRIGYVFQQYALFPHLSVGENVAYGLHGMPPAARRTRVAELLKLVGLGGREKARPRELSGGQQQRVALARALAPRPDLLLLDEPFAALDPDLRRTLRDELVALQRRLGVAVLFVTHDQAEAYAVSDHVAVYDGGTVLQFGPTEDVFARPATRRVAELTGARNILPGRVVAVDPAGVRIRIGPHEVDAPPHPIHVGAPVDLCIRPEHVLLVRQEKAPHYGERTNVLAGRIARETRYGTHRTLYIRLDEPVCGGDHDLEMDLPEHAYEVMRVAERRDWRVSLKRTAIHLLPRAVPL
jgi:molybdate transport system ATP-binding protein